MKDPIIRNVRTLAASMEILKEREVTYDRIVHHPIRKSMCYSEDVQSDGVHMYFMRGDTDVAYYTPIMECLMIHDKPRPWSEEILEASRNY